MTKLTEFYVGLANRKREVFQAAVELQHLKWQRMDQEGRHELCGDTEYGYCGLCQEINRASTLIAESKIDLDWDQVTKVARGEEIAGYTAIVEMGGSLDEEEV